MITKDQTDQLGWLEIEPVVIERKGGIHLVQGRGMTAGRVALAKSGHFKGQHILYRAHVETKIRIEGEMKFYLPYNAVFAIVELTDNDIVAAPIEVNKNYGMPDAEWH